MIIYPLEITTKNGQVVVSARVELKTPEINTPDVLWFEFPESCKEFITGSADGFAVALLLLAMKLREDMHVGGSLSPRLIYGMQEYQRVFNSWFPDRFMLIDINCIKGKQKEDSSAKRGVACAFSGGVDSSYTLLSHLPNNGSCETYHLSHALFVHGFDIKLEDGRTYSIASQNYEELMRRLGLDLLTARTNVREFVEGCSWELAHGAALISVALVLGRLLRRFYVPSSFTYSFSPPWGSHPAIDHLLSTETLEVIHDGGSVLRFDKISAIAKWSETYSRLRVCWERPNGLRNCCRCYNCILTMIGLDLEGALTKYSTFTLPLERERIRSMRLPKEELVETRLLVARAIAANRKDIADDIRYALFRSRCAIWSNKMARKIVAARGRIVQYSSSRPVCSSDV